MPARAELCQRTDAQGGECVGVGLSIASPGHQRTPAGGFCVQAGEPLVTGWGTPWPALRDL